jgi:hypothetical protein
VATKAGDKLAGLDRARCSVWFNAVKEKIGAQSITDISAYFELKGIDSTMDRWKSYSSLRRRPDQDFVRVVDRVVPGTRLVFKDGPAGLPLWDLLDVSYSEDKLEVNDLLCKRIFSRIADYQSGLSLRDKWDKVFQALIKHYGNSWTGSHAWLEKLVQDPTRNDIALSNERNNITATLMVIIMSLALLSLRGSESEMWDYSSYFMGGILGQPIENRFGKEVSDFITDLFAQIS